MSQNKTFGKKEIVHTIHYPQSERTWYLVQYSLGNLTKQLDEYDCDIYVCRYLLGFCSNRGFQTPHATKLREDINMVIQRPLDLRRPCSQQGYSNSNNILTETLTLFLTPNPNVSK